MKKLKIVNHVKKASFLLLVILLGFNSCKNKAQNKVVVSKKAKVEVSNTIVHPMDALSQSELTQVKTILLEKNKVTSASRFPEITLKEPSKMDMYAWKNGQAIKREANIVIRQDKKTYEAIVDITNKQILDWKEISNVQPALLMEEWMQAGELWKKDERVIQALKKRGYTNLDHVAGAPLTTGYFGTESTDQRLLKVWLLDVKDVKRNLFAKPINGITPLVDVNKGKVVDVLIEETVARNDKIYDYDEASVKAHKLKPVLITSPEGDNFSFKNGKIEWDRWKFHFRMDKRFGAIISLAEFDGQSVAYQLSANEMFVPYMDSAEDWKYRSYMDIGEYGFGLLSSPIELGTDVPGNATLLNAVIPMDDGTPLLQENVVGVFERNTGRPLWRHSEFLNETHESRAEVELVVRTIPVVGNYDYVIDYVFSSKGLLKIEVGATGMDAAKAVESKTMDNPKAIHETKVGNLLAPNLIGVFHDHFLSFRLDLDVDGINNSFATDEVVPVKYPNNSRKSGWEVVEHPELKEGPIVENSQGHDGYWKVVNKNSKNSLGQYKSYQILGHSYVSVLDDEDFPQKRAAWSKEQLWVTPYNKTELYPSGKYPNQSQGKDGILKWIAQDRSINNQDIVCWYTMGFHHISLPEDWPVLPTVWHTMTLRPAKSFDRNPAIVIGKPNEK